MKTTLLALRQSKSISTINEAMSRRLNGVPHEPEKISFHYLKYSISNVVFLCDVNAAMPHLIAQKMRRRILFGHFRCKMVKNAV